MKHALTFLGTVSALALTGVGAATPGWAQTGCVVDSRGQLQAGCAAAGAGQTMRVPVGANTAPETGPVTGPAGFVLSLDGETLAGDAQLETQIAATDAALADADVRVALDTLDPTPRLDVEIAGAPRGYRAGETATLISETNYPAFIARAEMRVINRAAPGGPRLLSTQPVEAGGRVAITVPEGRDIVVVHRVYDNRGRYDETMALALSQPDARGQLDTVEEGNDFTATRNIPVRGGTVTVSASSVARGSVLRTMGTSVIPDSRGNLVVQRILPRGEYDIGVAIDTPGRDIGLTRPIEVPGGEWFYVAVADFTVGRYKDGQTGTTETQTNGRIQFFVDGETEGGVRITSSLDTGDGPIDEIFQRLDEKDPRAILDRLDANDGYPTYGDDSTSEDLTPTSGRFYLRVEKDNSFLVWGDYKATLNGNGYVRNERDLYGLQGRYVTESTTARGDARATFDFYAAQPDQLVGRDVFRGTGGSIYFLSEQDISAGTQTLTVELRDSATGRVVDRVTLIEGRDYQINALQGVITLSQPLSDTVDRRLISTRRDGDETITLVAQYEYTPTTADVDGFSIGGRAEAWLSDDVRVGVTAMEDEIAGATQRTIGVDLRYELGENSFVQLDYAESDGPGFGRAFSDDGGLVFGTEAGIDDEGRAIKLEAQLDLEDLGAGRSGVISAYFENREQGFSNLDYTVKAATGDETLYGFSTIVEKTPTQLGFTVYADVYENDAGTDRLEVGGSVSGDISARLGYEIGLEYLDETTATTSGTRTDIAARFDYALRDELDLYVFGQATVSSDALEDNNRYGFGIDGTFENGWALEAELSGGDGGFGTRLLATQTREDNSSAYFGYELDPGRTLSGGSATRDNGGRYVAGGTRHINDQTTVFGENTYDIFGGTRELISTYGVTYTPDTFWSTTVTLNFGEVSGGASGDLERFAISAAVRYEDEDTRALGRIEFRRDDFDDPAEPDADSVFLTAAVDHKLSEDARLVLRADYADTEANGASSFEEGKLTDVSLGYAYRPVDNARLNLLARYRYFLDELGQEIDGTFDSGPVQESHVVSVEGSYAVNEHWTLGGKLGGRWTQSAAVAGDPLVSNDAVIGIFNARYTALKAWDILLEARYLSLIDAESSELSALGAVYRQVGEHTKVGLGYNFGSFSDDLTDLDFDDQGLFLNVVATF